MVLPYLVSDVDAQACYFDLQAGLSFLDSLHFFGTDVHNMITPLYWPFYSYCVHVHISHFNRFLKDMHNWWSHECFLVELVNVPSLVFRFFKDTVLFFDELQRQGSIWLKTVGWMRCDSHKVIVLFIFCLYISEYKIGFRSWNLDQIKIIEIQKS